MPVYADVVLYINDDSGNIGQVDITTASVVAGSVHNTGQGLTDIAFNSTGTLFGTTFTDLYSINPNTGAAAHIGSYGSVSGMNALVGSGGTDLLGASNSTDTVYSINAATAAVSTFKSSPAPSAGDLAFSGTTLYESAVGAADELVDVTTGSVVGLFHVGTTAGPTLTGLFGLADNGTTMYGVGGTIVYSVNLSNGVLTQLFDYSGHGLGSANGAAFIGEGSSVPEPSAVILLATVLLAVAFVARKRREQAARTNG